VEAEGRRCVLIAGDVKDSAFCRGAVGRTVRELGRLDILVDNAAHQLDKNSLEEISDEEWDVTFRTNVHGYSYMAKHALPHLEPGSAIINTGSVTGLDGSKTLLDYSATKGAIRALTKSLAQSLVDRKIRVNCVAPWPVWTPPNR
jgi:NAD(P)-dependent dehydrogenase (short-subunit alcohol dehydrogenase family)